MKLILLGGNSVHNKKWIEAVRDELKNLFDECVVHYYEHWKTKGEINWNIEIENLVKNIGDSNCIIFAKSAGIGVALQAIYQKKIKPKKCIFVGIPLEWAEIYGNNLSPYFINYKVPTMFIQQTNDPYTSFNDLKLFLKKNKVENCNLKEFSGNDHNYNDFVEIRKLVKEFLLT
ncbi:MAG: hypothetical protein AABY16_00710 [Nanoarchaeota archaeon]